MIMKEGQEAEGKIKKYLYFLVTVQMFQEERLGKLSIFFKDEMFVVGLDELQNTVTKDIYDFVFSIFSCDFKWIHFFNSHSFIFVFSYIEIHMHFWFIDQIFQ